MKEAAATTPAEPPTEEDRFEIDGDDLLRPVREAQQGAESGDAAEKEQRAWQEVLADIRIRIGTLLKAETVSFLLGAGASVECGGVLMSSVPLEVERTLVEDGISGKDHPRVRRWLRLFYLAARRGAGVDSIPIARDPILARRAQLRNEEATPERLPVNLEQLLAILHRWRAALLESGGRIRLDGEPPVDATTQNLQACLDRTTRALARHCDLPTQERGEGFTAYPALVRKVLTRPLNLKRVNVFTLNYDTLVEQAADAQGVVLLDGFVGTARRIFRPESYEQDLYFPAETTEGRVHRFDRVLHLYKLHGSITWVSDPPAIDNPYGVRSSRFDRDEARGCLIYPTPAKYGEMLGMPYAELFRRFGGAVARPQSVLFVIGYGFGDEHVNAIIRQALAVPSFTLVIVDPSPSSDFVRELCELRDQRVWVVRGRRLGTLSGFVESVLPDLRDEEIQEKVVTTFRALTKARAGEGSSCDDD